MSSLRLALKLSKQEQEVSSAAAAAANQQQQQQQEEEPSGDSFHQPQQSSSTLDQPMRGETPKPKDYDSHPEESSGLYHHNNNNNTSSSSTELAPAAGEVSSSLLPLDHGSLPDGTTTAAAAVVTTPHDMPPPHASSSSTSPLVVVPPSGSTTTITTTTTDTTSTTAETTFPIAPVKKKRGRPRKHPLPNHNTTTTNTEAASKIQTQWKKKKDKKGTTTTTTSMGAANIQNNSNNSNTSNTTPAPPDTTTTTTTTHKTVPPPSLEHVQRMQQLTPFQCRQLLQIGMRVKVRFTTHVKKQSQLVTTKKKWFAGTIDKISKEGTKIRIKYDDGSHEITKFPDKDVILDEQALQQQQQNHTTSASHTANTTTSPSTTNTQNKSDETVATSLSILPVESNTTAIPTTFENTTTTQPPPHSVSTVVHPQETTMLQSSNNVVVPPNNAVVSQPLNASTTTPHITTTTTNTTSTTGLPIQQQPPQIPETNNTSITTITKEEPTATTITKTTPSLSVQLPTHEPTSSGVPPKLSPKATPRVGRPPKSAQATKINNAIKENIVRSGRRAAQQANERISSKEENIIHPDSLLKKKRKKSDEEEVAFTQAQCDACGKWRYVPSRVVPHLPPQWFCSNNVWDPEHASCDAPVEEQRVVLKKKKKRRKEDLSSASPVPPENADGGAPVVVADTNVVLPPKPRGRGRPRRNPLPVESSTLPQQQQQQQQQPETSQGSAQQNNEDGDNVEWVMCEKCEKWRKLPSHISADDLPDTWYCTMNTWNPKAASCDAPEDKAEGLTDVGFQGNKLSYRNLIFGNTGRKINRPVSERARAAESLFLAPNDDPAAPPVVMYAKSKAFFSRSKNQAIIEQEENPGVLDLLVRSSLFAELKGLNYLSYNTPRVPQPGERLVSYNELTSEMNQSLKDLIVDCLGSETLTGDEVLLKIQSRNWDNVPESWRMVRNQCSINFVVMALCEMVRDSELQCVRDFSAPETLQGWNPRYRRPKVLPFETPVPSAPFSNPEAMSGQTPSPQAISQTHNMKLSKPWKRRSITP